MRLHSETRQIETAAGEMKLIILRPEGITEPVPGILWIHGGGYVSGMADMVYVSRGADAARRYGAVVVSPEYRLATEAPYPAALEDCYAALVYLKDHAAELGVRSDQIMVGGESAGGGLCAAVCMMARDKGIRIACQMPLYPMISNVDTESSKDNHGKVWNTRRNHLAWRIYLRKHAKEHVSPYAAPSWQTDYTGLPPCYTFVCDGEPFYSETLRYVSDLKAAGVEASADVYHSNIHAFDLYKPESEPGATAIRRFNEWFESALERYR